MLCPRCHQPIEGPEEFVCCGDGALEWRCRDCGKVSEGFAFPYGMCPSCDGALEILGDRRIDDAEAETAVRIAFAIELGGHAFYTEAAAAASEPDLRELFAKLAAMEAEHMATLARRYRAAVPAAPELSGIERAALFAGIERRPEDPLELLRLAIACEERAAAFFADRSKQAPDGSGERQLYRELAAEERDHADLLATELERRQGGRVGLL